jgi:hypothetical protein
MIPVRFAIVMILVLTALALRCSNGSPAAILRSLGQERQEGKSTFITKAVSDEQSNRILEEYLKDGIGVFKFGMKTSEVNQRLPSPSYSWQNTTFELNGTRYQSINRMESDFTMQWVWEYMHYFDSYINAFNETRAMFGGNPCVSDLAVNFLFRNDSLIRIDLTATDQIDCQSNEPVFDAIANFFQVRIVKFSPLGIELKRFGQQIVVLFTGNMFLNGAYGPAYQAGVRPLDELIAINGQSINGSTDSEIATKLQGPPGSQIVLTIKRANEGKPRDLFITRGRLADGERFRAETKLVCFSGYYSHISMTNRVTIAQPEAGEGCEDALTFRPGFY